MEFKNLISKLVAAMDLKKGSIVLLQFWGENKDLDILDKFSIEVSKHGSIPLKWQYSQAFMKDLFNETPVDNLTYPEEYFNIFNVANIVIDICMYTPPTPHEDLLKEKFPLYASYMRNLFKVLSTKEKFIQIKVPTVENALSEGIDFDIYNEAMLKALDIDYTKVKEKCSTIVDCVKDKNILTIYSGEDKKLSLSLRDRVWNKDDGDGSLPCGEVYIAPIENSANGEVLIPLIYLNGNKLTDVSFEFKDGNLINSSSKEFLDFIKSLPAGSNTLAEFGIGLNDNVSSLIGLSALDEKCIGTIHLALGMNAMFGGTNMCPFHEDYVLTPVKVELDGVTIFENGELKI